MKALFRAMLTLSAGLLLSGARGPAAPAPSLEYAFTIMATLLPPVEQGTIDGGRKRFIAITGGSVSGPLFEGSVLPGGGDWQTILPGGLARVEARYFLKATDGTVIEVTNPGVRTASPEVTELLPRGEAVDPSAYYFRTTPRFDVPAGAHEWMRRSVFVARGIRRGRLVCEEVDVERIVGLDRARALECGRVDVAVFPPAAARRRADRADGPRDGAAAEGSRSGAPRCAGSRSRRRSRATAPRSRAPPAPNGARTRPRAPPRGRHQGPLMLLAPGQVLGRLLDRRRLQPQPADEPVDGRTLAGPADEAEAGVPLQHLQGRVRPDAARPVGLRPRRDRDRGRAGARGQCCAPGTCCRRSRPAQVRQP